jgi:hypothetical protein
MSSQTFEVGNVGTGTWLLQSSGGAELTSATMTNSLTAAATATFYDSPTGGSHKIMQITVPGNGSLNYHFGIQLQRGLTVTSASGNTGLSFVITLNSIPDGPLNEYGDNQP